MTVEIVEPGACSIGLQALVVLFGILQTIFGTEVFSASLCIGVLDATLIFAFSPLFCRIIIYFEIAAMARAA